MTPFGHLSTAYLISRKEHHFLLAALAGSLIMDADIVLLPFGIYNGLHRIITHNLFCMAIVIGCLLVVFRRSPHRNEILLGVLAGMLSHLAVDCILDDNPSNGLGVAIFWPFSREMFCPFNLDNLLPGGWGGPLLQKSPLFVIRSMLFEIPVICAAVLVLIIKTKKSWMKLPGKYKWVQKR